MVDLPPLPRSPASLKPSRAPPRQSSHPGRMPQVNPARPESATVKASTVGSTAVVCSNGVLNALSWARKPVMANASGTPSAQPPNAKAMASVRIWRKSRHGLAPRADRTANSLRRALARASKRFEMLTQAISSTQPTAPERMSMAVRNRPRMLSSRVLMRAPKPPRSG